MIKTKQHWFLSLRTAVMALLLLGSYVALAAPILADHTPNPADHCADDEVYVSVGIDGENCIPRGDTTNENTIMVYLAWIIRFLAGGVGLVIAFMIVVGGVQYITASGNPEGVAHARKRITEALEALLLFIFMAAILNFIIPGGIL